MKNFGLSVLIVLIPLWISAQSTQDNNNYLWKVGVHTGSSMLWGDLSDDSDPITKMFSSQSKLSLELDLHRKITNAFGVQGSFLFGKLAGQRTKWSDDKHAGIAFNTSYFDYSLAVNADITALFGAKPNRLISFYLLGGAGMTHYTGTSYDMLTNNTVKTVDNKKFFVPWGWGLSFNFTPRLSVFAQNTFRHPFTDDFDTYTGSGSTVDDIYSFTSIGATYKFGPKREKKKKIDIVPVEVDTTIAKTETYVPVSVETTVDMPFSIKPNESKTVKVTINKGDLTSKGEYNQSFPDGFMIEPIDIAGGKFSYDVGKLTIHWDELPSSENVNISYKIKAGDITPNNYSIPGSFVYSEKDKIKVKQFKNQINVEGPVVAQNQNNENPGSTNVKTPDNSNQNNPTTNNPTTNNPSTNNPTTTIPQAGVSFGVQVAAVYGGRMNPMGLQKRYKLNETVNESAYKGYNNYTVGNFDNYGAANERRKGTNVRGSYVVAFKDGKYQPHLYYINKDVMDQNPFINTGTTYKVQILANNGRPYAIVKLAHKLGVDANKVYEDKTGNWYQYSVGTFSTMSEAQAYAKELKAKGFSDAFVIKFQDGNRKR